MSDDNVVKKVLQFKVTRIRKRGRLRLIAEISTWRMVSKYSSLTIQRNSCVITHRVLVGEVLYAFEILVNKYIEQHSVLYCGVTRNTRAPLQSQVLAPKPKNLHVFQALSGCAEDDILLVPFEIDKFDVHDECVKKVLDHFQQVKKQICMILNVNDLV
ncbi:hypothetical protein TNCV_3086051 [Trichonephila clavipes]|nr:hypothetical protein TNCV_3086051 [Trichonephila clavipes]